MTEFKGVTRSDNKGNWDFRSEIKRGSTKMKSVLNLHALPDYSESDTNLSNELVDNFTLLLEENGISNCLIKITDGYVEEGDDQHYRLSVRIGNDDKVPLLQETQLSVDYLAVASAGEHAGQYEGSIKVIVDFPSDVSKDVCEDLTKKAFIKYDELVGKNYPDWKTNYKGEPEIKI